MLHYEPYHILYIVQWYNYVKKKKMRKVEEEEEVGFVIKYVTSMAMNDSHNIA